MLASHVGKLFRRNIVPCRKIVPCGKIYVYWERGRQSQCMTDVTLQVRGNYGSTTTDHYTPGKIVHIVMTSCDSKIWWWRHDMEMLSVLLVRAFVPGNPPVTGQGTTLRQLANFIASCTEQMYIKLVTITLPKEQLITQTHENNSCEDA